MSTSLKLAYQQEVRRFTLPTETITFQQLLERAAAAWPRILSEARGRIRFTYVDDENEAVTVSTDDEVLEAVRIAIQQSRPSLRFDIEVEGATPPPTPTPTPAPTPFARAPEMNYSQLSQLIVDTMGAYHQFAPALAPQATSLLNALGALNTHFPASPAAEMRSTMDASSQSSRESVPRSDARHANVTCDVCGVNPIVGIRYKCSVRDDYDMCESCEATSPHEYPLLKIYQPQQAPAAIMCVLNENQFKHAAVDEVDDWRKARRTFRQHLRSGAGCRRSCGGAARRNWRERETEDADEQLMQAAISDSIQSSDTHNSASESKTSEEFEAPVKVAVPVAPVAAVRAAKPMARFVMDVTFPDGTQVDTSSTFAKTWRLRNDGEVTWPAGCKLVPASGDLMNGPVDGLDVPSAAVGEEVDVTLTLTAPDVKGRYIGYWRMQSPDGVSFGHRLWVDIRATDPPMPTPFADLANSEPDDFVEVQPEPEPEPIRVPVPSAPSAPLFTFNSLPTPPVVEDPFVKYDQELQVVLDMGFGVDSVLPLLARHIKHPASVTGIVNEAELQALIQACLA